MHQSKLKMKSLAHALVSIRYWNEPLGWAMKRCKMADERSLIRNYFHLGYEIEVILQFLVAYHGIKMSLSTLKRRLWDYGLKRRGNEVEVDQLRDIIRNEISGSGQDRAVVLFEASTSNSCPSPLSGNYFTGNQPSGRSAEKKAQTLLEEICQLQFKLLLAHGW